MSDRLDEIRARMRACKCPAHEDARWLLAEVDRLNERLREVVDASQHLAAHYRGQVERVLDLHTQGQDLYTEPNGGGLFYVCNGCGDDWPCATVRAIADVP